jgi:protein SCO1/2
VAEGVDRVNLGLWNQPIVRLGALLALLSAGGPLAAAGLEGGARLQVLPQAWTDDSGRRIELAEFTGTPVVLTMAYANCHRICPMTIEQLKKLQSSFDTRGEAVTVVVVGYDPANEDAGAWRQYRASHHLGRANWHFVTGTPAQTAQLASQLHFELWKYDEHVMHDSRVLFFDSQGLLVRELGPDSAVTADAL